MIKIAYAFVYAFVMLCGLFVMVGGAVNGDVEWAVVGAALWIGANVHTAADK